VLWQVGIPCFPLFLFLLTYIANLINPYAAIISLFGGVDSMYSKIKQFEDRYPLARYKNKLELFKSMQSNINRANKSP
jgi:hypothetical protein